MTTIIDTIIDNEPQCVDSTLVESVKDTNTINKDQLKDQLKALTANERYNLINNITMEERSDYIKKQQDLKKREEAILQKCPISKKVKEISCDIQDLKIDLQKYKNELEYIKKIHKNKNQSKNKCPYSIFRLDMGTDMCLNTNTNTNMNYENYENNDDIDKFCEELTETYTNSFSWFWTIMFIMFIFFILTSKPIKPFKTVNLCESLFSTSM